MKTYQLECIKTDPTGNITMLVKTPLSRENQPKAAGGIMEDFPDCEQVGFLEESDGGTRLQLMGGEFCGNATLSYAACLAQEQNADEMDAEVEVSGATDKVAVHVQKEGEIYKGTVTMPLPVETKVYKFTRYKVPVIKFPGIAHAIVKEKMPVPLAKMLIREWADKVKADAFGIMLLSDDGKSMTPIVYVKSTDTVVCEGSCASGTAAVGAFSALENQENVEMEIEQPAGKLGVRVEVADAAVRKIELVGSVRIVESMNIEVHEKIEEIKKD